MRDVLAADKLVQAGTIQLARLYWLGLFAQELRRLPLIPHAGGICARLTSRLAQESTAQSFPSQLDGPGQDHEEMTLFPFLANQRFCSTARAWSQRGFLGHGFKRSLLPHRQELEDVVQVISTTDSGTD
jgi:hypothetical protein